MSSITIRANGERTDLIVDGKRIDPAAAVQLRSADLANLLQGWLEEGLRRGVTAGLRRAGKAGAGASTADLRAAVADALTSTVVRVDVQSMPDRVSEKHLTYDQRTRRPNGARGVEVDADA